ncbi:uncharacterized protein STEHIDRAFT_95253 [Stereum hirsutum FP-91666 SS1]|uniref:uncharacterized protein n=1 Tax=Stereum hirsutum (strain FP-91666) TaxID=721885 RepID=UPI000440ADE3|nr:uncharacterized protein STEHIDRAFT_95253 [Stereum hirsutum FP-91666 SS1]EIM88228.1 hypothetical protein STEHIDRAFT_95253 [Stereum hirsutum FP-91666 SS1]
MFSSLPQSLRSRLTSATITSRRTFRNSSTRYSQPPQQHTSHAQFYSDLLPGMIPVALLGSAVYMGLQLLQSRLSHEKYLDEALVRIDELEAELATLRTARSTPGSIVADPSPAPTSNGWFGRFW